MQSYLIVGGTKNERIERAKEITQRYKVTDFDKITLKEENVKSIGIGQIRRLQHQLSLEPYSSSYKIATIPEAEKLTIPAQNAMLKLLEEPPKDTIIILCSTTSETLLPTIISRCQVISLIPKSQIKINKSIINHQSSIINSILNSGVGERIKIAGELAKNREKAINFCQAQLIIWREKMLKAKSLKLKAKSSKTLRQIQKKLEMLEANVNPKLALESLFLKYPSKVDRRKKKEYNYTTHAQT